MNFILRFRPNRSITLRGFLRRIVNDPSIHPSFRPSVFVESIKVYRREREKGGEGIIEIFIIRSPSSAIWNIGGPTRRRRSGRSEYIYIYTVRHNFPRITAGKKWRQRLSNLWRKGRSGIRFRVVGSLSRIPALLPPRPLHPLWFFLSVRPEPALFLPLSPSEIG